MRLAFTLEFEQASSPRPETGVARFQWDWPGIFMRGDDALGYAMTIRDVLLTTQHTDFDPVARLRLQELAELLESCKS